MRRLQQRSSSRSTLDELLRQIRETPHLEREALLVRLAERRRLAIALRTTLEAAEQVAAFGQAGAELLQDASLDSVVATMIEVQDQEKRSAGELIAIDVANGRSPSVRRVFTGTRL